MILPIRHPNFKATRKLDNGDWETFISRLQSFARSCNPMIWVPLESTEEKVLNSLKHIATMSDFGKDASTRHTSHMYGSADGVMASFTFGTCPGLPDIIPDNKVHVTHMEPTWVLSAAGGPHVGPMNLAIGDNIQVGSETIWKANCCDRTTHT